LFCTKATSSSLSSAKQLRLGKYWRIRPSTIRSGRSREDTKVGQRDR
jgi:hypothetical protein